MGNFNKIGNILFITSNFTLTSIIYSFYKKKYGICLLNSLLYLTSLNYWKNPKPGWRLNIDKTMVWTNAIYILHQSYYTNKYIYYQNMGIIVFIFYMGSEYITNKYVATFCHANIHFLGNIGNLIVYSSM